MSGLVAKAQRAASGSPNQAIGDFTTRDLAAFVALHEREVANRLAAERYGREMNARCLSTSRE